MNVLFVHNNFPAQFGHVAPALAAKPGVRIAAIGSSTARASSGIELVKYRIDDADVSATHPFARRFDLECRRAEQVLYALSLFAASNFVPDVIVAHSGWGETLPLRAIFPKSRLLVYCEFYYGSEGRDVGFDPEFPATGADGEVALHLKNAASLLALLAAMRHRRHRADPLAAIDVSGRFPGQDRGAARGRGYRPGKAVQ